MIDLEPGGSTAIDEALAMPDDVKEDFCRSLLAEFGADRVIKNARKGELTVRCVMPEHDDRKPSAGLNYKNLVYKCLACEASGGILWLIRSVREGTSNSQARDWLVSTLGLDGENLGALLNLIDALVSDESRQARAVIPSFSPRMLDPWALIHPWLTDPINWADRSTGGRGIPEQNVIDLQVGYAEAYPVDDHGGVSERIIVPHFWKDKLVGWQSRRLSDDGTPKWLSTPDFPKDLTLYRMPTGSVACVVESPMTVLRHAHHLPLTATFGKDVTDRQVRLLAGYDKVILWPDPDPAGWNALEGHTDRRGDYTPGLIERLMPYTDVWVTDCDLDVDGADMTDDEAVDACQEAVPASVWERPSPLRCYLCRDPAHNGECAEEA